MPKVKVKKPAAADLLLWYDKHRRVLPWRALPHVKANPYHVWLSEIMLQQTTVAAVIPYFNKFIKRWPDVEALAAASLDDIMRMWAGLGYYRRARMLHQCAQIIVAYYKSQFPSDIKTLLKLPGFGPYTAAAVATIAFDQRANVIDGNVERVMARIHTIKTPLPAAKPKLRSAAEKLLPDTRYGDYAQALMDLGATICTPRNPKCDLCPWQNFCQAYAEGIVDDLPRKLKPTAKPIRYATAFVVFNPDRHILIRQRPDTGLLGGMMEIPTSDWVEGHQPTAKQIASAAPIKTTWKELPTIETHVFSHFELRVSIRIGHTKRAKAGIWVSPDNLKNEALPSLMHKIARAGLKGLE
jgi:A/G-specific adenine glycosylase